MWDGGSIKVCLVTFILINNFTIKFEFICNYFNGRIISNMIVGVHVYDIIDKLTDVEYSNRK